MKTYAIVISLILNGYIAFGQDEYKLILGPGGVFTANLKKYSIKVF